MIFEGSSSRGITWLFHIYFIKKSSKCKTCLCNFKVVRWTSKERCKKDPPKQGKTSLYKLELWQRGLKEGFHGFGNVTEGVYSWESFWQDGSVGRKGKVRNGDRVSHQIEEQGGLWVNKKDNQQYVRRPGSSPLTEGPPGWEGLDSECFSAFVKGRG